VKSRLVPTPRSRTRFTVRAAAQCDRHHSAAALAAGFKRRQLALVLPARAYVRDPAVRVRIEAIEDGTVRSDIASIGARVQVRQHTVGGRRAITAWLSRRRQPSPCAVADDRQARWLPPAHLTVAQQPSDDEAAARRPQAR